jgi:hypothetical protein
VIQDAATTELLMLGFMNREALQSTLLRLRHVLQPHPEKAADEGRNLRESPGSRRGVDGLRPRHHPVASVLLPMTWAKTSASSC